MMSREYDASQCGCGNFVVRYGWNSSSWMEASSKRDVAYAGDGSLYCSGCGFELGVTRGGCPWRELKREGDSSE